MTNTAHHVTRGIVLRETETKEADKILTMLTADFGKIPVIARGARRKSCKFSACAQLLAYGELTLYRRGDWFYLDEGASLRLFDGLRRDLAGLSLASYFAELTEAVTEEDVPSHEILALLLNALHALEVLEKPRALVKATYELRLMSLAGYEPLADACTYCGEETPTEAFLDVRQGVLHCKTCGAKGVGLSMPLCAAALAALRLAIYGDPKRLYSFSLSDDALAPFAHAAEAYVATQLERGFRTLDFYKNIQE